MSKTAHCSVTTAHRIFTFWFSWDLGLFLIVWFTLFFSKWPSKSTLYVSSTLASKSRTIFCRLWLRHRYGRDFSLSFRPNAYRPRPSLIIYSVTWLMDRFIPWAILDMWVGRFGCSCGPFWILPWAVLDISKIYGPFWSGPFWYRPKPRDLNPEGV